MIKDAIKSTAQSLEEAADTTSAAITKSTAVIKLGVKEKMEVHPHREAFKQGFKSFFKKFLSVVQKVAEVRE